jgi:hypothetical protein
LNPDFDGASMEPTGKGNSVEAAIFIITELGK